MYNDIFPHNLSIFTYIKNKKASKFIIINSYVKRKMEYNNKDSHNKKEGKFLVDESS